MGGGGGEGGSFDLLALKPFIPSVISNFLILGPSPWSATAKAWFSIAAQTQAQAQAIKMAQAKSEFDVNTNASKIIWTFQTF